MTVRVTVVLTTIGDGSILDHYAKAIRGSEWQDRVTFIAIPDEKTPALFYEKARSLAQSGFNILTPPVQEQDRFLESVGLEPSFVARNSDHRRNVGFLMAYQLGHEVMVSIDDDNYCVDGPDFFKQHAAVASASWSGPSVKGSANWYNLCEQLEIDSPFQVFPRGFPYKARRNYQPGIWSSEIGPVRLSVGLWLLEPDLDAHTWLTWPDLRASDWTGRAALLSPGTWSPVNTQNTALHRDLLPAYYYPRMGKIAGNAVDRYGDILSGYLLQACMAHLGDRVRVGPPLVEHRRNHHDYMHDLAHELPFMRILDDVVSMIRAVPLEGKTYTEAYRSLARGIRQAAPGQAGPGWTDATRAYFELLADDMESWVLACAQCKGAAA